MPGTPCFARFRSQSRADRLLARLKEELGGEIVVHGSAQLVQTLVEHDLVDEFRLMVFPVVLGSGKRLFAETTDKKRLRLVESRVVGEGIGIDVYEWAMAHDRAA